MEDLKRSSEYLKEALKTRIVKDENGIPKIIAPKKKLVAIGIRKKGEKVFNIKS